MTNRETLLILLGALSVGAWPAAIQAAPKAPTRPPALRKPVRKPAAGKQAVTKPVVPAAVPVPVGPRLTALDIKPSAVQLTGPQARQLLLVTGSYSDGTRRDLSGEARYSVAPGSPASVDEAGWVKPVSAGSGVVRVSVGGVESRVAVTVIDPSGPLSFQRDIIPTLTVAGCNSLSCHGSPAGKAGFKLSMYGADPALDYLALIKQERAGAEKGPRADLQAPESSLFLKKATLQLPHAGGMRFKTDSPSASVLLAWLRAGAPDDTADAPARVTRLEVTPSEAVLEKIGQTQRFLVTAHYSDGTSEDVTGKSLAESNDTAVAEAEPATLRATGIGDTAVMVRYLGRVGVGRVLLPRPTAVSDRDYAAFQPANLVDQHTLARWKQLRFIPSARSDDATFLRRVSLDLIGTLPTPDEVRAFLADVNPAKRSAKIEELLGRPEYADWWTVFWGDLLRNNSRLVQADGARTYRDWIRQSVADNKPYNQFIRELITATGGTFTEGPTNFFRVARTAPEQAEQVSQLFLGVRLQCANCHNHPFEKWSRNDYHRFAAFFTRVSVRGAARNESMVTNQPTGEYRHPETRENLVPAVLEESSVAPNEPPADRERREVLAEWLTGPQNLSFARNLVNRLWGQMFGRGIVEPVDDVRVTNPATNEPLLDALARDFIARQFDVKHVLRTLANSATYQLSADPSPGNEADRQNFSRAYRIRLKAEALLDAVSQATGVPENFNGHPAGTRAIQLLDNRVNSYFLDIYGRPRREVVCTCEREETANLTQALHMLSGATVQNKLSSRSGRLEELLAVGPDGAPKKGNAEILTELVLGTLSRLPTPEEHAAAEKYLAAAPNRRQAWEDLFWVRLNSREFLFRH